MTLPVVILAGGLGTRLGSITQTIPKAMVEINGRPFIAHQLELLRAGGINRVVLCISHLGDMIRDYVQNGAAFNLHVDYSFDGPRLLGTAGAIRQALPLLTERFFVLYGDSYLPCDYGAIAGAFIASSKQALMTVYRNEGAYDASNVEFAAGRILAYDKKVRTPRMHHIDYGLGAFRREVFSQLPENEVQDLAALYQTLLAHDQLAAYEVPERFYEIGSVAGLQELSSYLKEQPGT